MCNTDRARTNVNRTIENPVDVFRVHNHQISSAFVDWVLRGWSRRREAKSLAANWNAVLFGEGDGVEFVDRVYLLFCQTLKLWNERGDIVVYTKFSCLCAGKLRG